MIFGAFWALKSASGDSSCSAVNKIIASAQRRRFDEEKLQNGGLITSMGAITPITWLLELGSTYRVDAYMSLTLAFPRCLALHDFLTVPIPL